MTRAKHGLWISITIVCCLIGGLGLAHFASGAADRGPNRSQVGKVVRAERFELVDRAGKVRAVLANADEGARLFWLDEEGIPRAIIGMGDGLLYFKVVDEKGAESDPSGVANGARGLSQFWHFSYGPDSSNP